MIRKLLYTLTILYALLYPTLNTDSKYLVYISLNNNCITNAEVYDLEHNTNIIYPYDKINIRNISEINYGVCVSNSKIECIQDIMPTIVTIYNISLGGDVNIEYDSLYEIFLVTNYIPEKSFVVSDGVVKCKKNISLCIKDGVCNSDCKLDPDCEVKSTNTTEYILGSEEIITQDNIVYDTLETSSNKIKYVVIILAIIVIVLGISAWKLLK